MRIINRHFRGRKQNKKSITFKLVQKNIEIRKKNFNQSTEVIESEKQKKGQTNTKHKNVMGKII